MLNRPTFWGHIIVSHLLVRYGPLPLFLSQEYLYRASEEVELASELVLQEPLVRVADILREIAEERERRAPCRKLGYVLDLDVLALPCRWRIVLDLRKHLFVDLRSRDLA